MAHFIGRFLGRGPFIDPRANREEIILPTNILSIEKSEWSVVNDHTLSEFETPEEREIYLEALEIAREIGDVRKRFWNMLVATVARSGYKPPQGRQTIILDLGCGGCMEGLVLSAFFGG
jgi:hypothetical protein